VSSPDKLNALVTLSRDLGDPEGDYAILAEGNTSLRTGDDGFLVKASGFSLVSAQRGSFVELRLSAVLGLLDSPPVGDDAMAAALADCRMSDGPHPSVESVLHAVCLTLGAASTVAHTHPTPVNAILCSRKPEVVLVGPLFPDQVVVCGRHPLLVPYVDPGIPLALEVRDRLSRHVDEHGRPPKTIYLQNHGLIALGQSGAEVVQITAMAAKAARVLLGSFAAGGPQPLSPEAAVRIESRPDEHRRQAILGLRPDGP
jgi:rhamnose utilization protein RhaD (predicted bifunctional aldolase and dehydrogenase)